MPDYTVKWPLEFTGQSSGFDSVNETIIAEMVNFNLKNIILTEPGERLFYPNFGVGVKRYLFEQNNVDVENLHSRILSQIRLYAPYAVVRDLEISMKDHHMNIILKYEVKKVNISEILNLDISL
jgi:phage baseplate assembly protein W